jgi:hypothetical protein
LALAEDKNVKMTFPIGLTGDMLPPKPPYMPETSFTKYKDVMTLRRIIQQLAVGKYH